MATICYDRYAGDGKRAGRGARQYLVAFGYAGWGPGQLDAEIQANGWLSVAADAYLVFDDDDDSKWQRALAKLGVSLGSPLIADVPNHATVAVPITTSLSGPLYPR